MTGRRHPALRLPWAAVPVVVLAAASCSSRDAAWTHRFGAEHALVGTIRDVAAGRDLGERELVARLAASDFVLIGEAPGNADHARLAARIVTSLAGKGRRLAAVALDLVPTDTQPLITEHMAAHPGDAAGLGRAIMAADGGRPRLARHAPVLEAAVAAGAQVVAPDLSAQALRGVLTHGFKALQPAFVRRTGLAEPLPAPVARGLRAELAAVSCERTNGRALDAVVRARRARDASMADRLAAITGRDGQSVLVAAATHVRSDRGVPWYLPRLRPAARTATLAFVELPAPEAAPPTSLPYDYVWFTPSAYPPGFDPCATPPAAGGGGGGGGRPEGAGGAGPPPAEAQDRGFPSSPRVANIGPRPGDAPPAPPR